MTKDKVKEMLDRVLTWPSERQADVAHMVELMEEQDNSTLRLTDEQAAEVRRRLADKNAKTVTLAEFNERTPSS
jgi:16S rRNA U1498 N3-methylase RsmE